MTFQGLWPIRATEREGMDFFYRAHSSFFDTSSTTWNTFIHPEHGDSTFLRALVQTSYRTRYRNPDTITLVFDQYPPWNSGNISMIDYFVISYLCFPFSYIQIFTLFLLRPCVMSDFSLEGRCKREINATRNESAYRGTGP